MKALKLNKKIAFLTASAVALAGLGAIKAYAATSVIYRVYDYSTGTQTESYTLTQSEHTDTSAYSLVRLDNRETYNNSGVVRLTVDGKERTGFVVDDHTIATAAENIYDYDTDAHYDDVTVTLYNNSGIETMTISADEAHYPMNYEVMESAPSRERFNYAFIVVSEDLSDYEHMQLGEVMDDVAYNTVIPVRIAGVSTKNGVEKPYTSIGRFDSVAGRYAYTTSFTLKDEIGGPVYLTTAYRTGSGSYTTVTTTIGILIDNGAVNENVTYMNPSKSLKINSSMLQFFYHNDYNPYD